MCSRVPVPEQRWQAGYSTLYHENIWEASQTSWMKNLILWGLHEQISCQLTFCFIACSHFIRISVLPPQELVNVFPSCWPGLKECSQSQHCLFFLPTPPSLAVQASKKWDYSHGHLIYERGPDNSWENPLLNPWLELPRETRPVYHLHPPLEFDAGCRDKICPLNCIWRPY